MSPTRVGGAMSSRGGRAWTIISAGPSSAEHGRNRQRDDLEIEPHRLVPDVLQVEVDHRVEGNIRPALDLPEPGDAGRSREPGAMRRVVVHYLVGRERPW